MRFSALRKASVDAGDSLRKHAAAVVVLALWCCVSVHYFFATDAADVTAQAAGYGTLSTWSLIFVAGVLGLRRLQDAVSGGDK